MLNNGQAPGAVRLRLQAAGHAPTLISAPGGAFEMDALAAAAYTLSVVDGPDIASDIALAAGEQRTLAVTLPAARRCQSCAARRCATTDRSPAKRSNCWR
ncbi:carboxypeptidase-like regulatory domain-containing protein [Candidatus Amarolinea dominans]|uniref:carboxypeptidase-like regulatory domain-containing protein n=1 Tax=Candidatus Amarolinea dominans TaxID=3140696 RepID=UPI0031374E33|nr:hypothetical protein [Anaerolineae bacterium]